MTIFIHPVSSSPIGPGRRPHSPAKALSYQETRNIESVFFGFLMVLSLSPNLQPVGVPIQIQDTVCIHNILTVNEVIMPINYFQNILGQSSQPKMTMPVTMTCFFHHPHCPSFNAPSPLKPTPSVQFRSTPRRGQRPFRRNAWRVRVFHEGKVEVILFDV